MNSIFDNSKGLQGKELCVRALKGEGVKASLCVRTPKGYKLGVWIDYK